MITLQPIGFAYNERTEIEDDHWGEVISKIILNDSLPEESLFEIETFSHLEIIYYFHKVGKEKIITGARHPRNNTDLPKVGIFAQRGKNRPNLIGLTTVKFIKREGRQLFVQGLDCINGTPILDIKPVMKEFLPKEPIKQPAWTNEIMENYWK
ncbi:SAM-dependent methyltransferase [Bacillus sp. DTU_2020_1000418_1_SI_GHA_SEK_038]|uniref:SAM-dependent methyltransferase n=1 Tax=Bacillus sp. DTU_2020_1000418_1_SI_GHA_SEK_038 TaxID=3077585 RepID=UPI0028EA3639|nr:SAM-dependent methyltransferase [Bacillus sp. DTU_2020_1000418_1_SI_GHA_SEK_038]WNS75922.1 SAM-dependent methyltransferase [Bacillus sp. DTU_2020_1000418_1_SI_GHA_SEK_038]